MSDTFVIKSTGEAVEAQLIKEGIYVGHYQVVHPRWQRTYGPELFGRLFEHEGSVDLPGVRE